MLRHDGLVERYLERMEEEIADLARRYPGRLETIYFGGGTPSSLDDRELERLVRAIDRAWGFPATAETTLEADPLTFDRERLRHWRSSGFSRLSIGVQSFQEQVLRRLGRRHDPRSARDSVGWALAEGFEVSVDIITAVDGQDASIDLHEAASSGVAHVSVYTLTVEPFTPFALRGVTVDEDRAADDFELAAHVLTGYGLERYEVSSHAKTGHESRHNQVYWHGRHFLGAGPAAASFLPVPGAPGERVTNPPIKSWLAGSAPLREVSGARDYLIERLMTGLRTRLGVDLADAKAAGAMDPETLAREFELLVGLELLEWSHGRLRATESGLIRLDAILRRLVAAIDAVPGGTSATSNDR